MTDIDGVVAERRKCPQQRLDCLRALELRDVVLIEAAREVDIFQVVGQSDSHEGVSEAAGYRRPSRSASEFVACARSVGYRCRPRWTYRSAISNSTTRRRSNGCCAEWTFSNRTKSGWRWNS